MGSPSPKMVDPNPNPNPSPSPVPQIGFQASLYRKKPNFDTFRRIAGLRGRVCCHLRNGFVQVSPIPGRWEGSPYGSRSAPKDLPHEALGHQRGSGKIQVLVLFEEAEEGQEEQWSNARYQRVLCRVSDGFMLRKIFEKNPTKIQNYGIWLRYQSRTGYHNMYKEFRDTTLNGAVEHMYNEMASRHRVRFPCIQIIKTATIPAKLCKRESTKQFHDSKIKFPLVFKKIRPPSRKLKTTYKAKKPNLFM
ncbi:hypothetical protein ACSQ67_026050 [Phaseolus vulgaris]